MSSCLTSPHHHPSQPTLRSLVRDSAAYVVGSVSVRVAPLILVPLLAHVLRPEQYGIVDLLTTLAAVAAVLVGLGLDAAVGRFFYDVDERASQQSLLVTALGLQLLIGSGAVALLAISAPVWAHAITGREGELLNVRLALLSVPPTAALTCVTASLRVRRRIAAFTFVAVAQAALLVMTTSVVIALGHRNESGVLLAAAMASTMALLLAVFVSARDMQGRPSLWWMRRLIAYGAPIVPASLAVLALPLVGRVALAHLRGPADVALIGVAAKVAAVLGLLIGPFQLAWPPFALSIAGRRGATESLARALPGLLVPACLLGVAISLASTTIVAIIATPAYAGAAPLVPWLALGAIASGAFQVTAIAAVIARRPSIIAFAALAALFVCAALTVPLVWGLGAEGAAVAAAGGLLLGAYLPIPMTRTTLQIPFSLRPIGRFLVVSGGLALVGSHWTASGAKQQIAITLTLLAIYLALSLPWALRTGLLPAPARTFGARGGRKTTEVLG